MAASRKKKIARGQSAGRFVQQHENCPLVTVLASMDFHGFKVDAGILHEFGEVLSTRIRKALEKAIYMLAGEEFNINSTKQLGAILFEKLNLPAVKRPKPGIPPMWKSLKSFITSTK